MVFLPKAQTCAEIQMKQMKAATKVLTKYVKHCEKSEELSAAVKNVLEKSASRGDLNEEWNKKCRRIFYVFRVSISFILIVAYSIVGGFLFSYIETKHIPELKKTQDNFLSAFGYCLDEAEQYRNEMNFKSNLTKYYSHIFHCIKMVNDGLLPAFNENGWTFYDGFIYSFTILTTIGFGNYSCKSKQGKLFTIIYGVLGIPLMVFVLQTNGKFMLRVCKKLQKCAVGKKESRKKRYDSLSIQTSIIYVLLVWTMCSLLIGIVEEFSLLESFYFYFQTITTIGFGDIQPKLPFVNIFVVLSHFLGLSLLSMIYAIIQEQIELRYIWALQLIDEEQRIMRSKKVKEKKKKKKKKNNNK